MSDPSTPYPASRAHALPRSVLHPQAPAAAPPAVRRIFRADAVRTVTAPELSAQLTQLEQDRAVELQRLLELARAEGHAAGLAQARAEGEAAVLRAGTALEQLTATVCATQESENRAGTGVLLETALQVAEWVVRRELTEDGTALLGRLEAGLTALLPSPTTRISVSHADHALVSEWAEGRGRIGTVVTADQRLAPGDAVVTTDAGRAEVTVAAALRTAAEALGLPVDHGDL